MDVRLAAVIAMFHDVLFVVGIFAWLGKPVDGVFLAAALTIVGLSVNDTVVVFDRIRELRRARPKEPLDRVINDGALQTVPRTVNTGLGAMFILAALLVLGGESLTDFALALLLGLLIGTYSSVFAASPLLLVFERRWPVVSTTAEPARASRREPARAGAGATAVTGSAAATGQAGGQRRRRARRAGRQAGKAPRAPRRYDEADPYAFVDEAAKAPERPPLE
jgi:SecD/SecF fusion protein